MPPSICCPPACCASSAVRSNRHGPTHPSAPRTRVWPSTVADAVSVGSPRNAVKALRAVRASGGAFVTVSDEQLAQEQPAGALGPRYQLAYRVPDGSRSPATVTRDLYPEAAGGPVTYTRAGQPVFGGTTTGGWYRAPAGFGSLLTKLGVPGVTAPTTAAAHATTAAAAPAPRQSRPAGFRIAVVSVVVVVFATASAAALYRRSRPQSG